MSFHEKIAIDPGNSLNRDSGWIQATTLADARRLKRTEKYFSVFLRRIRSIPTHSILVLPPELLKCFDPSPPPHLLPFRLHHNRDLIQNQNLRSWPMGPTKTAHNYD